MTTVTKRYRIYCITLITIIALSIFCLRYFFFQLVVVEHNSMNPNLLDGDQLLILHSDKTPQRKEVFVFLSGNGSAYVKRCLAIPGDTVQVISSRVYINGKLSDLPLNQIEGISKGAKNFDPEIWATYGMPWQRANFGPVIVPQKGMRCTYSDSSAAVYGKLLLEGTARIVGTNNKQILFNDNYYFMVGDNRSISTDSRTMGFINSDQILGRGLVILYSRQLLFSNRFFKKI